MMSYYPFEDAVKMPEPTLLSSLAAGNMDERRLIRDAQAYETSLSGRLAGWVSAIWARHHEIGRRGSLTPGLRPVTASRTVTWQEQMQTR